MSNDFSRTAESALETIRGTIGDRRPSIAVVEAIASFRGVDPTTMTDTLHEYVDPGALDTLLQHQTDEPVSVTFQMGSHEVELTNDGGIELRELD